ncbi:MAG: thioredoxin-disulfide reductase [Alphaproteobacteria bacterium]|nr:thioredoxin-disulfide reductase [Alphaproteobacteria bacterium]
MTVETPSVLTNQDILNTLIIGAGPAGYTAAIYLARYGRNPVLVTGMQPGGQLTLTTEVENFPGFAEPIQGPWLMDQCRDQALACGARIEYDTIHTVDFSVRPFQCMGDARTYYAHSVIICTGAATKWLGLDSETLYRGHGVSSCATCDGRFFKDKDVAIVGGGNTAAEEAIFLSQHAKTVTLIHRRDALRADKVLQQRLFDIPKLRLLWNHKVVQVLGTTQENNPALPGTVTGIVVENTLNQDQATLPMDGLFVAIGHSPNTGVFQQALPTDSDGYLLSTPGTSHTSIPGIFVAGDVQDHVYRQAVTAAGQGCMAAMDAERFLQVHMKPSGDTCLTVSGHHRFCPAICPLLSEGGR